MFLDGPLRPELRRREGEVVVAGAGVGEGGAAGVEDGDVGDGHPLDGPGHERGDALDLRGLEPHAAPEGEHDGGARRRLPVAEGAPLREDEVDPGLVHAADVLDRPRQLAFEGALVVQLLHEVRHAERAPVEELVADGALRDEAGARELEAEVVDGVALDVDGRAALAEVVRDVLLPELLDDLGGVGGVEPAEEEGVVRPVGPVRHGPQHGHAPDEDGPEREPLPRREPAEEALEVGEESHGLSTSVDPRSAIRCQVNPRTV